MNIQPRKASTEDAKQIQHLVQELTHFYLTPYHTTLPAWLTSTFDLKSFESRLTDNNYINLVYEKNAVIVGYISVKDRYHIYHLFVSEAYQHQGIARSLWSDIKKICREQQYTVRSSLYAVPVYEKFGFRKTSSIQTKDNIQFQSMKLSTKSNP